MNYIYLHGFCSGENSYKGSFFRERFAAEKGLQLHTPDLNGNDFEHLTMTGQLAIVRKLIDSLDGDIVMMGSSMGGYLSTLLAEDIPRIKKMVIIAPAFQFAARYLKRMDERILESWRDEGYIEVYHHAYQENRRLHYGILEDARQYDQRILQREMPALIFHGIDDESVSYQLSIDYLDQNPEAQVMLLKSDHAMVDQSNNMWQHIQNWLNI